MGHFELQRGTEPETARYQPCAGFPAGHVCPVFTVGAIYCNRCRALRQEVIAAGIPTSGVLPIGTVLEDFEGPTLMCKCGGDATAYDHRHSLLHVTWEWRRSAGNE